MIATWWTETFFPVVQLLIPVVLWMAFWLFAVNWKKTWPTLREGAWAPVELTPREYDLLAFLMRHPRQAFSREELLTQVWNWSFGDSSTVTVHVRRLREKIEHDPALPRRIVTVWGFGYRYELEDA